VGQGSLPRNLVCGVVVKSLAWSVLKINQG
jgi:hypothetical protein